MFETASPFWFVARLRQAVLFCFQGTVALASMNGAAADSVDYLRDIKPLLKERCYSCHGALKQKGELRLDTGEAIRRGTKHGSIVAITDVANSALVLRVSSADPEQRMPPEGEPLTPEQIARLQAWIVQGAASPSEEKPEPDPREHWAFKRPIRSRLPTRGDAVALGSGESKKRSADHKRGLRHAPGIGNAIDAFVFAGHAAHGLIPAPAARKEVLLRRVYLDLVGMPPSRDELRAFLADPAPDAYEKVVNQLLASPQYGERWARHWMDIWRYADWYGRRHVPDVWNSAPQVWRWRDWIVQSLNADRGLDEMIVEMVAGDEVASAEDSARVATGYLVRNWYALNQNQWMRDIVEHTGKAFLGLTFNCAHCHDHKYDPITQRDYFRFRAFFEPLQVRQDRVPGEPDPGAFQKYEYSVTRKVVTAGMVSVFDGQPEAKTFIYERGDERSVAAGKPTVTPGVPAFLTADAIKPKPVRIAPMGFYPGLKPFIQEAETRKRDEAVAAAKNALEVAESALLTLRGNVSPQAANGAVAHPAIHSSALIAAETTVRDKTRQLAVAEADAFAIRARIRADIARHIHGGDTDQDMAASARAAERTLVVRQAEASLGKARDALALFQAEQSIALLRRNASGVSEMPQEKASAEAIRKKMEEEVAAAQKRVEAAQETVHARSTEYTSLTPAYPKQSSGRRLALARWMTGTENPMTARVAVNHIWARHFHSPIVSSVFDFGRNGAKPTHPELLDWLAVEFMENGWSMKHLHRLIVTSDTYRRASSDAAAQAANELVDRENRHLWRMNAGQMEAEVLRDSILHLAGELDRTRGGPPLPNAETEKSRRRSLYFECFPEPGGQSSLTASFDPPEPLECYRRTVTVVPQQALALGNSHLAMEQSRVLARRLTQTPAPGAAFDEGGFIVAAFEQVLTRAPSDAEIVTCRRFLAKQAVGGTAEAARASLVHTLINHHDFVSIR